MNTYMIYLLCLITGYLTGSILFAWVITKLVKGEDIRNLGNHNPGAANTFKSVGWFWGILTGLLDSLKAFVPMLIADHFFELSTVAVGLIGAGAIIGHGYPIFFNFKGGRAAGTLLGIYLYFIPYELLASFIIVPLIVYFLIKKDMSYWTPFGLIVLSAVSCLFFNHPADVKIMVFITGMIGLYFNRNYLPVRLKVLFQNKHD